MNNFCVDEIATNNTVRQRAWFKTRPEAIKAANLRQLGGPIEPTSRLCVYELTSIHFVGQEVA